MPGAWFVVITGNGEEPWASTDSKALPPPPPPFTSHWQAGGRREVLYGNYIKFFLFYTFYVGFGKANLSPGIYIKIMEHWKRIGTNIWEGPTCPNIRYIRYIGSGVVQISEKGSLNIWEGLTKYLSRAHLPVWSRWLAAPRQPHPVGFCTSR